MNDQPGASALRGARYRKSSYSSGAQECIAVGQVSEWTGVQDTKQHADSRQRGTLAIPATLFATFVTAVKNGQLHS